MVRRCFIPTIVIMIFFLISTAYSHVFHLSSAIGFQNEGTSTQNHFSLLSSLDGQWAPKTYGTVTYNYYATGTSNQFWDALSLNFDLSLVGWNNITSATLRFYTQQGAYYNLGWHQYQLLQGAFNLLNQDFGPIGLSGLTDFGNHGSNGLVGWLEAPVPLSWIATNNFDITLRLWNARIDYIELQSTVIPEPSTFFMLGVGFFGLIGFAYKRKKS